MRMKRLRSGDPARQSRRPFGAPSTDSPAGCRESSNWRGIGVQRALLAIAEAFRRTGRFRMARRSNIHGTGRRGDVRSISRRFRPANIFCLRYLLLHAASYNKLTGAPEGRCACSGRASHGNGCRMDGRKCIYRRAALVLARRETRSPSRPGPY